MKKVKVMPTSKRMAPKEEVKKIYCRKCQKMRPENSFYSCTDHFLDKNGKMSVCKSCIVEIYNNFYKTDLSMEKSIYRTCKALNIRYDEKAVISAKSHIQTFIDRGTETKSVFGLYKSKLIQSQRKELKDIDWQEDLTFKELSGEVLQSLAPQGKADAELIYFWGDNLAPDDYAFLEKEFSEWQRSYRCDTKAEEILLKDLCHIELKIRKARNEDRSVSSLNKDKIAIMKVASVDPAKAALVSSGKSLETFSNFVKMMEETDPADFYKDKELFKDFDNIGQYYQDYVTRPIKNFITKSRDFSVAQEDNVTNIFEDDQGVEE